MKPVITAFFLAFPINLCSLLTAFDCIASLKYKVDVCWLHLNWWSISTLSSFNNLVASVPLSYVFNLCNTQLSVLLRKMAWNFVRVSYNVIIVKPVNYLFFQPLFLKCAEDLNVFTSSSNSIVVSKLCKSALPRYVNRLFRYVLNNKGSNIERWSK